MKSNRAVLKNLIAVEGIDGSGTTTLTTAMEASLTTHGIACQRGSEPTDGATGKLIRQALSGKIPLSPESLAILFAADRAEHIHGVAGIRQIINSGKIYITDRYMFSSLAYQSLETDRHWVEQLNSSFPLPEILIYLALPAKDAMNRIMSRTERDIYETEAFQNRVSTSYDESIAEYTKSKMAILRLDARQAPEEILAQAMAFLR